MNFQKLKDFSGNPGSKTYLRLALMQISRCFIPSSFGNVKKYECTYLQALNNKDEVHCFLVKAKVPILNK